MIAYIVALMLTNTPLALTGNEEGVWFIGDIDPSATSFTRAQDLDYELCEQVGESEYLAIHPFTRRPAGLAVEKQTMWFIDDSNGVGLYTIQLASSLHASSSRDALMQSPVMRSMFQTENHPTDFLLHNSSPLLVFGSGEKSETTLAHYVNNQWEFLPSVNGTNAFITSFHGELLSAVQGKDGHVRVSSLQGGQWELGDFGMPLEGELFDFIRKDDWPILVTVQEGVATLVGIQKNNLVELANFPIPKGRWGVTTSSSGFTVVGVERNGTTTVVRLGWPSGTVSDPITLTERMREDDSLLMTVLFVSMVCMSFLLLSKILNSRKPQ